jgi:hypothetical protein
MPHAKIGVGHRAESAKVRAGRSIRLACSKYMRDFSFLGDSRETGCRLWRYWVSDKSHIISPAELGTAVPFQKFRKR